MEVVGLSPRRAEPGLGGCPGARVPGCPGCSGLRGEPRDFLKRGGSWPVGPFLTGVPVTILHAAEIVTRLGVAIERTGWSNTRAAVEIGIGRQALQSILASRALPDLHTLARAETALAVRLWPDRRQHD